MLKSKLALKRLTASDLTFFEWHFRHHNAGNQKAINLNRDVFVDVLYPALPDVAEEKSGRIPLDLSVFGPGGKPELNLQRKIVKFGTYKNWRLNGEFIHNPQADPDRFNGLKPDDIAIFEFFGAVVPVSSRLILVGASYPKDVALHASLNTLLGNKTMVSLTIDELAHVVENPAIGEDHPVTALVLGEALEDAVHGGASGLQRLWKGASRQRLTAEALQKARFNAENIGRIGEIMVNAHLDKQRTSGHIDEFLWVSDDNAVAPYDFTYITSGNKVLLDVKSTTGAFTRTIHLSTNELRQIASGGDRYDLYRVYAINGNEAKLRIAQDLKKFAVNIFDSLDKLREGVTPGGFSVDPELLGFGKEITIAVPDDEGSEE
jgi:hypothetical protein